MCRALAQKLSIRFQSRDVRFVEVITSQLFSKYFSESAARVGRLFQQIEDLAKEGSTHRFVVVLIDEVESISAARQASASGELSSGEQYRIVNALLTHLDRLHSISNVLCICTSNIGESIDRAFLDRSDMIIHLSHPALEARYQILHSSISEMIRCALLSCTEALLSYHAVCTLESSPDSPTAFLSLLLLKAANATHGASGRYLRKLPLLAYSPLVLQFNCRSIPLDSFLPALLLQIDHSSPQINPPNQPNQ